MAAGTQQQHTCCLQGVSQTMNVKLWFSSMHELGVSWERVVISDSPDGCRTIATPKTSHCTRNGRRNPTITQGRNAMRNSHSCHIATQPEKRQSAAADRRSRQQELTCYVQALHRALTFIHYAVKPSEVELMRQERQHQQSSSHLGQTPSCFEPLVEPDSRAR